MAAAAASASVASGSQNAPHTFGRTALARHQSSGLLASPHTPIRAVASPYGSPSSALRGEEDCLVLELGNRFLRIGFANERLPRCVLGFGPDEQRRPGDYRKWALGYAASWRGRLKGREWGDAHELWSMDLRGFDLGLVEDKLERAVREASSKYLLTDSKSRRILLALPSTLPHALLSTVLTVFFNHFQCPTISLLPIPLTTTVAAGTRSALVVDIGWKETHVTAIFEYREVYSRRSNRAGKTLSREMQKLLIDQLRRTSSWNEAQTESKSEANCLHVVSFEECEEVLARVAWCQSLDQIQTSRRRQTNPDQQSPSSIGSNGGSQESLAMMGGGETSAASLSPRLEHDPEMKVPLTSTKPPVTIELPFSHLALPVEVALFEGSPGNAGRADDDELPISDLAYEVLLTIPEDVRATCMSRIIVTGGGSQIPGMKQRLVQEVQRSVESHGWDKVRGEAIVARKLRMEMAHQNKSINEEEASNARSDNSEPKSDQETDPITARFLRDDLRKHKSTIKGVVRGIESLGAWTGASLAAALRIRSAVELERDKFLSQGLLGVMRSGDGGVTSQRLSGGVGDSRSSISDGWKGGLGAWV